MSIVPSGGGGLKGVTSSNGSGINVNTSFGITNLTSGLVAGTNISLVPSSNSKSLTINASPGSAGVATVGAGNAGITIGGTAINPTISNNGIISLTGSEGIVITTLPDPRNPVIVNNGVLDIIAGAGINVDTTVDGTPNKPAISNNGVITVGTIAGNGISIGGTTQNPEVFNTGLISATEGLGILVTTTKQGTGNTIAVANNGVITVSQGTGITIGGTAQNPVVNATGVLGVTASGAGITVGGTAQNPILANSGITSIVAGSNITANTVAGVTTISAVAGAGVGAGAGISVASNVVSLAFSAPSYPIFPVSSGSLTPTVWSPTTNTILLNGGPPTYIYINTDKNAVGNCNIQVLINPTNYGGSPVLTPQGVPLGYMFNTSADPTTPIALYFFTQNGGGAITYTGYTTTLNYSGFATDVIYYTVAPNAQPFPSSGNNVLIWKNGSCVYLNTAY